MLEPRPGLARLCLQPFRSSDTSISLHVVLCTIYVTNKIWNKFVLVFIYLELLKKWCSIYQKKPRHILSIKNHVNLLMLARTITFLVFWCPCPKHCSNMIGQYHNRAKPESFQSTSLRAVWDEAENSAHIRQIIFSLFLHFFSISFYFLWVSRGT